MSEQQLAELSLDYLLTNEETQVFKTLVIRDDSPYTPFIIILLKETNNDIARFLRVLSGLAKAPGVPPKGLIRKVLMLIKESIITTELNNNPYVSITDLTRLPRFEKLGINRNTIYAAIRKYGLR